MEKLTLEHLAPYSPYGLKGYVKYDNDDFEICELSIKSDKDNIVDLFEFLYGTYKVKPILRPLSDLTKEIEIDGEKFVPGEVLSEEIDSRNIGFNDYYYNYKEEKYEISNPENEPYFIIQLLFKWHFDVYGLIDEGLAIDINTLEANHG